MNSVLIVKLVASSIVSFVMPGFLLPIRNSDRPAIIESLHNRNNSNRKKNPSTARVIVLDGDLIGFRSADGGDFEVEAFFGTIQYEGVGEYLEREQNKVDAEQRY